jgi:hypothetical protein
MKTVLALVLLMVGFGGSPCNKEKETCTLITTGTQTFMDKNLVVVTYRNGDVIPQVHGVIIIMIQLTILFMVNYIIGMQ